MRILSNTGADQVIDYVRLVLGSDVRLDLASPGLSVFAFAGLLQARHRITRRIRTLLFESYIRTSAAPFSASHRFRSL